MFSSCVAYKNVPYFQDLDSTQVKIDIVKYTPPVIQKNDILGIYITSESETTQALFGTALSEASSSTVNPENPTGFLVNVSGDIKMPTLGVIHMDGLTTNQAEDLLVQKVSQFVNKPTVAVKILNFKISVNGEVTRPGVYSVANGKVNVVEAITMAGDMKITATRQNVLVVRQEEGRLNFTRLDMRSKKVFQSPYFYLRNNDLIYIEPNIKLLERDQNIYRNLTAIVGVLGTLALIYSRF